VQIDPLRTAANRSDRYKPIGAALIERGISRAPWTDDAWGGSRYEPLQTETIRAKPLRSAASRFEPLRAETSRFEPIYGSIGGVEGGPGRSLVQLRWIGRISRWG
jgi:hypothetical protein